LAVGAQAQVKYGIKAGLNFPKLFMKETEGNISVSATTKASTSFYVSGYANIEAAPNFAIQPGISYQGKGGIIDDLDEDVTMKFMSIEIPVNLIYYLPVGNTGSFFIGAGPYVGFNVSAKAKLGNIEGKVDIGSNEDDIKMLDYGANFQLGYKLTNGFLINGGYGLGLGNLANSNDGKLNNRVFSFGVGFEF
jgi:hypothetical protein